MLSGFGQTQFRWFHWRQQRRWKTGWKAFSPRCRARNRIGSNHRVRAPRNTIIGKSLFSLAGVLPVGNMVPSQPGIPDRPETADFGRAGLSETASGNKKKMPRPTGSMAVAVFSIQISRLWLTTKRRGNRVFHGKRLLYFTKAVQDKLKLLANVRQKTSPVWSGFIREHHAGFERE